MPVCHNPMNVTCLFAPAPTNVTCMFASGPTYVTCLLAPACHLPLESLDVSDERDGIGCARGVDALLLQVASALEHLTYDKNHNKYKQNILYKKYYYDNF